MQIRPENAYICVATYDRNQLLEQLLESLRAEPDARAANLIIVDNSPGGTAEATVARLASRGVYVHEPRPGIAEARNAALDSLPDSAEAVVFVDDDEVVTGGWLSALIACANSFSADVVTGPVVSRLPATAPRWIVDGRFLQRDSHDTGPYSYLPATNNTLVRAKWFLGEEAARFDEAYSLTGGSDTELFHRLRQSGARICWCEEAVVEEDVPASRLTRKWVWRRGVRSGNVLARLQLKARSRPRVLFAGFARLCYGTVRVAWRFARLQPLQYSDAIFVMRGVGFFGAVFDRLHVEYARPSASTTGDGTR